MHQASGLGHALANNALQDCSRHIRASWKAREHF